MTQNNFDLNFDANTLVVSGDNNRVGIGTAGPRHLLDLGTSLGKKLSLWDNGSVFYGFGIQSDLLNFYAGTPAAGAPSMTLKRAVAGVTTGAALGLGTTAPTQKLHVLGNILVEGGSFIDDGVIVTPDYVFEKYYNGISNLKKEYEFKSLDQIESFIKENKHLPGIKSAAQIKKDGWDLSFASRFNLEKVEELFLHTISQDKKIKTLNEELNSIKDENEILRQDLETLKKAVKLLLENKKKAEFNS